MPGGLSRLLIRAFVHRPFRNGNDRWRRGEVGGTVRVEYTRGEGNGETRIFLRRYSIPLSLRFRNSTIRFFQPIFPNFRIVLSFSLSFDSTTSDVRIFDETVPENERSPVRRERAEEVTMWRKKERENSHAAKRSEGTSSYAERPRERG